MTLAFIEQVGSQIQISLVLMLMLKKILKKTTGLKWLNQFSNVIGFSVENTPHRNIEEPYMEQGYQA